jgi:O-antigen ligase
MIFTMIVSALILAIGIALGTLTAVINSPAVLYLTIPVFIVFFALKDYRIAVVVLVALAALGQSRFLPSFSGFNVFNYLILGAASGLGFRWIILRQTLALPPKVLLLLLLPIGFGFLNGVLRLNEIPAAASLIEGGQGVSPTEYTKLLFIRPLLYVVLAVLLANAILNSKIQDRWAIVLTVSAALPTFAVLGLIVSFGVDLATLSRNWAVLGTTGLHKNNLGGILALNFTLLLFLTTGVKSSVIKGLLFGLAGLTLAATLITFSRSGTLSCLVGWVLFCWHRRSWPLFLGSLCVIPLMWSVLPEQVIERLMLGIADSVQSGVQTSSSDELSAGRFWIWAQQLDEFANRPLFGHGLSGNLWTKMAAAGETSYPHNFLLSCLLDLGIVGTALVLAFYAYMAKGFVRLAKSDQVTGLMRSLGAAGFAMLAAYFVFGLTGADYSPGKEQIPLWLMFGVLFAHWPVLFPKPSVKHLKINLNPSPTWIRPNA